MGARYNALHTRCLCSYSPIMIMDPSRRSFEVEKVCVYRVYLRYLTYPAGRQYLSPTMKCQIIDELGMLIG